MTLEGAVVSVHRHRRTVVRRHLYGTQFSTLREYPISVQCRVSLGESDFCFGQSTFPDLHPAHSTVWMWTTETNPLDSFSRRGVVPENTHVARCHLVETRNTGSMSPIVSLPILMPATVNQFQCVPVVFHVSRECRIF